MVLGMIVGVRDEDVEGDPGKQPRSAAFGSVKRALTVSARSA
jgi:hypothetical protein